ncbi:hypothetical protein CW749_02200 [Vibrio sp. vnigr-6D03]|uniref:hypothetical protein n=1 Tax=Vibrio sp. vnigr-6D03 TaxID=2058088 RepID=UPI000C349C0A|nr:hypothetical protein [Vibrio sp. vnigr-6D03]PKF81473.1 hypothetical protein CW749_02200 [Vibrio sp. vnigr-6D03]
MPLLSVIQFSEGQSNDGEGMNVGPPGWYMVPEIGDAAKNLHWCIVQNDSPPTAEQQRVIQGFSNSLASPNDVLMFMSTEMKLHDKDLQVAYNTCFVDCDVMDMNEVPMNVVNDVESIVEAMGEELVEEALAAL